MGSDRLAINRHLQRILNGIQAWAWLPPRPRRPLLRLMGISIAPDAVVLEHVHFVGEAKIGPAVFINTGCYFGPQVMIGENLRMGPGVKVITESHAIGPPHQRCTIALDLKPITLGRGCWIGGAAVILPGAHVADGCVIAGGAVVTKPTEPDGLYAGNPARRIRDLTA
jgi:maltose O-acetyltransferase